MGRTLVLCFDGTSNKYGSENTNVVKLYAMLQRDTLQQFTYYQTGIGTLDPPGFMSGPKRWFLEKMDLAFAIFLSDHVTAGYRFLMRYYEPGDRIFMFGFSRGAYTARVLAGMLHKVGLLTRGNEEIVPSAWQMYKSEFNKDIYQGFAKTFSRAIRVHFLGLWDTVSSIGWAWDPRSLSFTAHNPSVDVIRHAVALDERRAKFVQNLWGKLPGQDLEEVWFAGVHSDIGGGYEEKESGLSKITLKWMLEHAQRAGLMLDATTIAEIVPAVDGQYVAPNALGPMHQSLHGAWWIAEYLPLPWRVRTEDGYETQLHFHCGKYRRLPVGAKIDASANDRANRDKSYMPPDSRS